MQMCYQEMIIESCYYANGTSNQIDLLGDTHNTDWQKEVFRTAIINDFNVSGGILKIISIFIWK